MNPHRGPAPNLVSRTGPPLRLQWEERGSGGVVRLCDPAVPVIVSMRSVDPAAGMPDYRSNQTHPTLGVRAAGIKLGMTEEGFLLAWVRLADGQWRAIVAIDLESANGRTGLQLTLYVRPEAVRKRDEDD